MGISLTIKLFGAVDIGGTKIQVGIVEETGRVLEHDTFLTPLGEDAGDSAVEQIVVTLQKLCDSCKIQLIDLQGIGVVCAGPIDMEKRTVENPYTLPGWEGFPIAEKTEKATGLKVHVDNDANGALVGELVLNKTMDKRVLMLTFGTGIGVAFWNGSNVYRCEHGLHPEMGHIIVSSEGDTCYCGRIGCFEKQCSGTALNERAKRAGFDGFDELLSACENNNQVAQKLIFKIKQELQNGFWSLCSVFKPDIVILGGGLMKCHFPFVKNAVDSMKSGANDFIGEFELVNSNTEVDAPLVGAMKIWKLSEQ